MVVLAEGADLQGPAGQRVVLAPTGLPYLGQGAGWGEPGKERKNRTQQRAVGQGEAAAGSLSYLRGPGDTAGHRQGIRALRSWQGRRFPRFREDLGGNARGMRQEAAGSAHTPAGNPTALARTASPAPGLSLRHPKLKLLQERALAVPANPLPGWGRHRLPPGDAQTAPQAQLAADERQDPSHQRSGQQGPRGDMGGWCAWRRLESVKPSGKMDLVTTHLCSSAKVVQIPRRSESSSAVLHVGYSVDQHQDPQVDANKEEQRSPWTRWVTRQGVLQETGQHWWADGEGGIWLLPLAN